MRPTRAARALALAAFLAAPVSAAETPYQIYARGDFAAAAAAGEALGNGEGLALAARAALAEADLMETPCLACYERAENLARRAIAADANRSESHVFLSVALGHQARIIGILRASQAGLAVQARSALGAALGLAPGDPWVLAALGGWHLEVVRFTGSLVGRVVYGASAGSGKEYFRRAIAAAPDNPMLSYQFALSLSGYDLAGNEPEVRFALNTAVAGTARTAYESALRARAAALRELLGPDTREEYRALVRAYQGYP